jgi:DNA-binding protein Fis
MSPKRYTFEQYADALRQAGGDRASAAAILGCSRGTLRNVIYAHPELRALCAPTAPGLCHDERYRPDEVADALRQAGGIENQAASLLGCCRATVGAYITRYPEVRAARDACAPRLKSCEEVLAALRQTGGNKRQAARLLGVGYKTLYNYIERYPTVQEECAARAQAERERRSSGGAPASLPQEAGRHPERFSPETVAEALRRAGGVKSHAAKVLRCNRDTVEGYIRRHPDVREAWVEARETMVDTAEIKLREAVDRGEWRAIRYTLSTLGRDRGYGATPPQEDPFAGYDDDKEFRRALDLVYGKKDPDQGPDPPHDPEDCPLGEVEEGS